MSSSLSDPRKTGIVDRLDENDARWFALRTANRHEKIAAKLLEKAGIEYYLPLRTVKKHYPGKIINRQVCLLPCYLFVRIVRAQERDIYENPYAFFLRVGRDRLDIDPADIELLRRIAGDDEADWELKDAADWPQGQPVELVGGFYTGWRGEFVEQKNKSQVIIRLQSILTDQVLVATVDSKYIMPLV